MDNMLNMNDTDPVILALTNRNRVLEAALAGILRAVSSPPQQHIAITKQKKKKKKKKKKEETKIETKLHSTHLIDVDGIRHIGSKNNRALYECDYCKKTGPSYIMKIHTCSAMKKDKKKKRKEEKEVRRRRKDKAIIGYTLESGKKGGSVFYSCDHCHVKLLESSVPRHQCKNERPIPVTLDAFVLESSSEEDNDNTQ